MRAARKYTHQSGRLQAASTCRDRGWEPGTWLASESWSTLRRFVRFDGGTSEFVKLSGPTGEHFRVFALPADVQAVPAPVQPQRCIHSRLLSNPCKSCGREAATVSQ